MRVQPVDAGPPDQPLDGGEPALDPRPRPDREHRGGAPLGLVEVEPVGRAHEADELEGVHEVGVAGPYRWHHRNAGLAGAAVATLHLPEVGLGRGEMHLGPHPGRPCREHARQSLAEVAPLGIQAKEMLVIEDQRHAGALVDREGVGGAEAEIVVLDNNSGDGTAARARAAGAAVRQVSLQGKGNVVRRGFADVEADVYVLVDGDDTYEAAAAPRMVAQLLDQGLDMVVGARRDQVQAAYRPGHRLGNVLLTRCAGLLFGRSFDDMLSGYRVFSRRYVKSFAAHAHGFETETELAVHALQLRMPVAEVETAYGARPEGSQSKLNTWRDGWRILMTIVKLFKAERPLLFFSFGFIACALSSVVLALPLFETYVQTGLVPRFPTAILCVALMLLGFLLFACGLVLDTVTRGRIEAKHLAYLRIPHPGSQA